MKILNEYSTHHYFENYEFDRTIHCPSCGHGGVWVADSGDYYEGSEHICTECNCFFTLPSNSKADERQLRIVEQLKHGKTFEPITPRGH